MVIRHLLISYDIISNRKRTKIANEFLNFGLLHVQKSVFEGEIKGTELKKLKSSLKKYISRNDSIRYYTLCNEYQLKTQVCGMDQQTMLQQQIQIT